MKGIHLRLLNRIGGCLAEALEALIQAHKVSLNKGFKGVSRLPPVLLITPIPVKFDRQGHSCNLYGTSAQRAALDPNLTS